MENNSDLYVQMYSAMLGDDQTAVVLSITDQKTYLISNVSHLTIDERADIGRVLTSNGKADRLEPCAEGTMVNLDIIESVTPHLITKMYELMRYIMSKKI